MLPEEWLPSGARSSCGRRSHESGGQIARADVRLRLLRIPHVSNSGGGAPQLDWHGAVLRRFDALSDEPGRYHSGPCPGLAGWTARSGFWTSCALGVAECLAVRQFIRSRCAAAKGNALVSAIWFVLLGGLLAANAKLSLGLTTVLAALLGLYHGYLNGTGMTQSASAVVVLLGLVSAIFILVALAAAFVVQLRAQWARIAVRVAGSWIAASGFLMLGWAVRTR